MQSGRVGLDEEPQQHFGAAKALQRKTRAVVRDEREIGRLISDFDHLISVVQFNNARSCPARIRTGIAGRQGQRAFEFVDGALHHPLGGVNSTEIHKRIVARIVARRGLGFLQPGMASSSSPLAIR